MVLTNQVSLLAIGHLIPTSIFVLLTMFFGRIKPAPLHEQQIKDVN